MSTPNLNLLLSAYLSSYDNLTANTPLLNRVDAGNPSYGATTQFYDQYFQAGISGSTVLLPATTCFILWVRNRNSSAATLGVSFGLVGGGTSQAFLGQGDLFVYYNAQKTNGFTSLTLTGVTVTVACEVFIAA